MTGPINILTDNNFDQEVLQASTPVLVDFWATWCGPCRALAPTLEQLSLDYSEKIKFCKLDVDQNPEQAAKYGIRSIPTLVLFKEGKAQGQLVGNLPRASIEQLLKTA